MLLSLQMVIVYTHAVSWLGVDAPSLEKEENEPDPTMSHVIDPNHNLSALYMDPASRSISVTAGPPRIVIS